MERAWLSVVGIGDDGLDGISSAARTLIDKAEVLIGGKRHHEMVDEFDGERLNWRVPLVDTMEDIRSRSGKRVCILATGDPMWFGIGATLRRYFRPDEMHVVPAPSAFSLAAARMQWPLDKCETITVHGRPLSNIAVHLYPNAKWLLYSKDACTPAAIAEWLCGQGFDDSVMTVLERLGGEGERIRTSTAGGFGITDIADLNTIAIECIAGEKSHWYPRSAGLPDAVFAHDGQLTKQEVRAITLAKLQPAPGALLWDVGAGCGSVAIEWMRSERNMRGVAIEANSDRLNMIAQNAERLGASGLHIVPGRAPDVLAQLENSNPDAVFIGGGLTVEGVFETAWRALSEGGRMVCNVVTLEGEARLGELYQRYGGELTRIGISRADQMGGFSGWKPLRQVTQWSVTKHSGETA